MNVVNQTAKFVPETKERSFEEIEASWKEKALLLI